MHNHDHGHHHHGPVTVVNRAFVIGIILNTAYVIAEVIAGFITNSMALLSDAGHNLSDVAALALSLVAFRLAKAKPTQLFTYGYKKTTILAALINAVVLLVAIGMLAYESISRISHPEPVQGNVMALVAGMGIVINSISAFVFFRNKDHDLNTRGAFLHLLTDAVVSFGVVVAGIIIRYTNWYWLDPVISLVVLVVILFGTWSLLTDSLRLSLDAVPRNVDMDDITAVINKVKGVEGLHHTHIWAMSTTENALTTHVILRNELSFEEKMKVIHNIKHELEHNNIQHATIELESAETPCEDINC